MHQSTSLVLLLLLPLLTFQLTEDDVFDIQGRISCKLQKKWCWEVKASESSSRPKSFVKVDAKGCSMKKHAKYVIAGRIKIDGSRRDYEFGLTLTHSCTPTGASKTIRLPALWKVPPAKSIMYEFKKDFNLP